MQFGKTLVGGIIGAALGIGLLIVVYLAAGIDKMWMAIPVALLTGLGVRMVAATSGHGSYLRGAITVVLAMGAYLGGLAFTRTVASHRTAKILKANVQHTGAASEPGEKSDGKTEESAAEAPAVNASPLTEPASLSSRGPIQPGFATWDAISLAVAALVAYELGRGSDSRGRKESVDDAAGPVPAGTHPDA